MNDILEQFTTNAYKILKKIYDCQKEAEDGTLYVPVSQIELSKMVDLSFVTVNKCFQDFKKDGLLQSLNSGNNKGKYRLTNKGFCIVDSFEWARHRAKEALD